VIVFRVLIEFLMPKSLSTWLSFGDSHLTVKLYKLHYNTFIIPTQLFSLQPVCSIHQSFIPFSFKPCFSLHFCSNSIWKKSMIFPFITQFIICGNGWNFYFGCVKSYVFSVLGVSSISPFIFMLPDCCTYPMLAF
jgi:hypothetical protein